MICLNSSCRLCARAAVCAAMMLAPKYCPAADTVETFDIGASDMELYAGFDGLGAPEPERGLGVETVMGFGLTEGISSYLAATLAAAPSLSAGEAGIAAGIFGTPVDGEPFDLDLMLEFGADGPNLATLHVVPSVELNLDFEHLGLYLRTGVDIHGSVDNEETGPQSAPTSADLFYTPGIYINLGERHQLLLEYHGAVAVSDAPDVTRGGFSFGWNVALNDRIELINEVGLTLPDEAETSLAAGLYVGLVATVGTHPPPALIAPEERRLAQN